MASASVQQLYYLKAFQLYLQVKVFSCSIANCNKNKKNKVTLGFHFGITSGPWCLKNSKVQNCDCIGLTDISNAFKPRDYIYIYIFRCGGIRGDAVGWGTALQVRRTRVRFAMGSLGIFYWLNISGRTVGLGSTQPLTEISNRHISWGWRWPVRRADKLITFMCHCLQILGVLTSWSPKDPSRPLCGTLNLYTYINSHYTDTTRFVRTVCVYLMILPRHSHCLPKQPLPIVFLMEENCVPFAVPSESLYVMLNRFYF
jgi:hypothetical protein